MSELTLTTNILYAQRLEVFERPYASEFVKKRTFESARVHKVRISKLPLKRKRHREGLLPAVAFVVRVNHGQVLDVYHVHTNIGRPH